MPRDHFTPQQPTESERARASRLFPLALAALLLGACSAGPDYKRPAPPPGATAPQFKEAADWKTATPGEIDPNQPWWSWYRDPVLDGLVAQAMAANASLAQSAAQYRQAQALVLSAEAAGMPTLGATAGGGRSRTNGSAGYIGDVHNWSLTAGWEPDLWGRVSRSVEAAQAGAQASASDLAAARLAVQAALVNNYLQLRLQDAQLALFGRTVQGYEKALQLAQSQKRAGVVTQADVSLAEATLNAARAQATDIGLVRKQLEHAVAVLSGKTPSDFTLAPLADPQRGLPAVPAIPALLPSSLLERRPDIASAERRVAVANANIGVAQAAWFPRLAFSATAGNTGQRLANWFAAPTTVWALGTTLAASLYDGGLRTAQNKQALAAFDAAAAGYRQTVLAGFQEVEDNLAALGDLERARAQQEAAAAAARTAERVLLAQYRAGTTNYLAVITAQALTLTNERAAFQVQGRQLAASVALIKATGGGFNATSIAQN